MRKYRCPLLAIAIAVSAVACLAATSPADAARPDLPQATDTIHASGAYGTEPTLTDVSPSNSWLTFNPPDAQSSTTGSLTCDVGATNTSPVGIYPISDCSGFTSSFFDIFVDVSLPDSNWTIDPCTPELHWLAISLPITYGTPILSNLLNPNAIGCDGASTVPGGFIFTPPVGTVPYATEMLQLDATFTPTDTTDFVSGGQVTNDLTVLPADLTVTASNESAQVDGPLPTLAWSANFVNGDTASSLTTRPTCVTTAHVNNAGNVTSLHGTYPITCSGGADPNYNFRYASGTLTVGPADTIVQRLSPEAVTNGRPAKLEATLIAVPPVANPSQDVPVKGAKITLELTKEKGHQSCTTGPTNVSGVGSCTIKKVTESAGKGSESASYKGDADYKAAAATDKLTVKK